MFGAAVWPWLGTPGAASGHGQAAASSLGSRTRRRGQREQPVEPRGATKAGLAQVAHGLDPAEALLDPLAAALARARSKRFLPLADHPSTLDFLLKQVLPSGATRHDLREASTPDKSAIDNDIFPVDEGRFVAC